MSVNLSRRQLNKADLIDRVRQVFAETRIAPQQLVLEITESTVMSDLENGLEVLANLRNLGVKLSMDDFGTGYSSLSSLHRLPIDALKVDRSFVSRMVAETDAALLVRTIAALARNLDLTIVAEGVETREQLAYLAARGCDVVQGYLFGRPMPAELIPDVLEAQALLG